MYGLSKDELRFAVVISSSHFAQHVFYRILPPLIPVMAVALTYPLWQLGLLITFYLVGSGLTQAPLGIVADRRDRRHLLTGGLVLTGGAYVLFSFAPVLGAPLPSIEFLGHTYDGGFLVMALAMLIVGVGLAVVHPAAYPMISDNVSATSKGRVLGVFGASSKVGDAFTPAVVAGLILLFSWEEIILLFGAGGMAFGALLFVVLRDDDFETIPSGQREPSEETTVTTSGTSRRSYLYPMTAIYFFFISSMLSTRALNAFLPAFVVAVYAYSFELFGVTFGAESVANIYFACLLLGGAATQLLIGRATDIYDARTIMLACMATGAVGMAILAVVPLHPVLLFVVIAILGTGLYGVNPARDALISDFSPPEREGRTFGYIFTAVLLTGAPLPTLIGYLLETTGMREGFFLLAIGPVLAGIAIALLYSDRVWDRDARSHAVGSSD